MNLREEEAVSTQVCFNLLLHQPYLGRKGEQGWGPLLALCKVLSSICSPLLYTRHQISVVGSSPRVLLFTRWERAWEVCAPGCRRHVHKHLLQHSGK